VLSLQADGVAAPTRARSTRRPHRRPIYCHAEHRGRGRRRPVYQLRRVRHRELGDKLFGAGGGRRRDKRRREEPAAATPSTRARRPRRAINYDDFELDDDDEGLQLEPDDDDGWD